MKRNHIIAVVAAILIILFAWWWMDRDNQVTAPETQDTINNEQNEATDEVPEAGTGGTATDQLPTTNDAVAISDQTAGASVTVDNYVLNKPGYIVVHEVTSEGAPGTIVGQSGYLAAGRGQDLEIKATIASGKEYMAMIHVDNGDKKFSASQDIEAMSAGKAIVTTFSVVQ